MWILLVVGILGDASPSGPAEGKPVVVCLQSFVAVGLDKKTAAEAQKKIVGVLTALGAHVLRSAPENAECPRVFEAGENAAARQKASPVRGNLAVRIVRAGMITHLNVRLLDPKSGREVLARTWKTRDDDLFSLVTDLGAVLAFLQPSAEHVQPVPAPDHPSSPGPTGPTAALADVAPPDARDGADLAPQPSVFDTVGGVTWALWGGGAAAVLTGGIFGALFLEQTAKANRPKEPGSQLAIGRAQSHGRSANISYGVGATMIASGLIVWWLSDDDNGMATR